MSLLYSIKRENVKYLFFDLLLIMLSSAGALVVTNYSLQGTQIIRLKTLSYILLHLSYLIPLYFFRAYRVIWIYSSSRDYYLLAIANFLGFLICRAAAYPLLLSHPIITYVTSFFAISSSTLIYRLAIKNLSRDSSGMRLKVVSQSMSRHKKLYKPPKILIVGAGEAGRILFSEYVRRGMGETIFGFVDDDPTKIGKLLNGKRIISSIEHIIHVINRFDITEIVIAMPSVKLDRIYRVISLVRDSNKEIPIKILPHITKPFETTLAPELREMGISDLIDRDEVNIDISSIESHFTDKVVMITGAGGSIGSELCRQLLKFRLKKLIALGRGEHSIYNLNKMLNEYIDYLEYRPEVEYKIANVTDLPRMDSLFDQFKPDILFHAAAHKHVHLMESNESEAFYNNVIGTRNILDLSLQYGVKEFALISTDKAVHPVSIMGISKRLAELITLYYCLERDLVSSIVRFGNVVDSRDSVIPLFREQIERGGPVTITHPAMTRYFMSIPEAALLVINAVAYMRGGEIFLLDMGEQYKIEEIARNLMRLYGYEPDKDIPIEYIGLRPGEKLCEELFYRNEKFQKTRNHKILVVNADSTYYHKEEIEKILRYSLSDIQRLGSHGIREVLRKITPEYRDSVSNV
jgi:FlaA1/EpsC-like NDP-sugar epimerase